MILPKWLVSGLGGLLIALVCLVSIIKLTELKDILKNKNPKNTIGITAQGKVMAVPDMATVNLGVLTQGLDPSKIQEENSKKIEKIIEYIKSQGISKDDIATSQFNIYPQYNYEGGKNNIVGYQLNQTITVKIKGVDKTTENLSKILKASIAQGVNEVSGVNIGFSEPDDLKQNARKLAIENAKSKAEDLAKTAGLKLGKVVSINEDAYDSMPTPYYREMGMGMGGGSASPSIEPGTQDIVANMTVVFEVK